MTLADECLAVRPAEREEFPGGAKLLADSLGFSEREAIPGWQMLTASQHGGLALAAVDCGELVGWLFAFPAVHDQDPYLFCCGLAVREDCRSRGIGRRLKEKERVEARTRGYRRILWTAEPLSSTALRLYLSGLGARLTGYSSCLYEGVRQGGGLPQDDVELEWDLEMRGAPDVGRLPRGRDITRTESITGSARRLLDVADEVHDDCAVVELPWDLRDLIEHHPEEALQWRLGVRTAVSGLIASGQEGVAVRVERTACRSFLHFAAPPGTP